MKNIFYLSFVIFISSCGPKLINYKLTIIQGQNLGFEEGSPLKIKSLINYINADSIIFVPEVKLIREDIESGKSELIQVPLTKLNEWRKSIGMLPVQNLMNDYDQNIPKLLTPKILSTHSDNPINESLLKQKYPNAILINLDSVQNAVSEIAKILLSVPEGKSDEIMIILFKEITLLDHISENNNDELDLEPDIDQQKLNRSKTFVNEVSKFEEIPDASDCPSESNLKVIAELNNGVLFCNVLPENQNYSYSLKASDDPNFETPSTSIIPLNKENQISYSSNGALIKPFKKFANVYFKFYVTCNNVKKESNVIGPTVIACVANGSCKILLKN